MKSRPLWCSRGTVEDGCMFTVQPHAGLAVHSNTWTRRGNRLRQTETGIPSLDQLRRIWLLEIRGRLNSQSTIRYGRDLRLRQFWNVAVSIMMQKWHCVRQDWSMMREHQLESVWNSLQHLRALRIYSRESLGPVHADIMRNSTPSIGIARAITARRWQRPFWQRRGPPEGNLADRVFRIFMLEFMWSKHKELRLHFLWNVLSWPISEILLIVSFADFNLCGHVIWKISHELRAVKFLIRHGICAMYLCIHTHTHLVMVQWHLSPSLLEIHRFISANSLLSSCRIVAKEVASQQMMKKQQDQIGDFRVSLLAHTTGRFL